MKKQLQIFLSIAVVFLTASGAYAASSQGGPHGAPGIGTLFWPAVNFLIYLALINWAYRKIGKPALISHSVQVRDDLKKAARSLADAESLLAQAEGKKARLAESKASLLQRLREEGKAVATNTIENAQIQANVIKLDGQRRIEGDIAKTKATLRTMVVKKATELARNDFERELSAEQDMNLRKAAVISVLS